MRALLCGSVKSASTLGASVLRGRISGSLARWRRVRGKKIKASADCVAVADDLAVADIQALWRRHLVAEAAPVSVVDNDGAVIATSVGARPGGTLDLTYSEELAMRAAGRTSWPARRRRAPRCGRRRPSDRA
jgi:hypothetical protein